MPVLLLISTSSTSCHPDLGSFNITQICSVQDEIEKRIEKARLQICEASEKAKKVNIGSCSSTSFSAQMPHIMFLSYQQWLTTLRMSMNIVADWHGGFRENSETAVGVIDHQQQLLVEIRVESKHRRQRQHSRCTMHSSEWLSDFLVGIKDRALTGLSASHITRQLISFSQTVVSVRCDQVGSSGKLGAEEDAGIRIKLILKQREKPAFL